MNKKEFIDLIEEANVDENGNLYIDGEYGNKIYFATITTICSDLVEEYCCTYKDGSRELHDRHFTLNDDTLKAKIVREVKNDE